MHGQDACFHWLRNGMTASSMLHARKHGMQPCARCGIRRRRQQCTANSCFNIVCQWCCRGDRGVELGWQPHAGQPERRAGCYLVHPAAHAAGALAAAAAAARPPPPLRLPASPHSQCIHRPATVHHLSNPPVAPSACLPTHPPTGPPTPFHSCSCFSPRWTTRMTWQTPSLSWCRCCRLRPCGRRRLSAEGSSRHAVQNQLAIGVQAKPRPPLLLWATPLPVPPFTQQALACCPAPSAWRFHGSLPDPFREATIACDVCTSSIVGKRLEDLCQT